MKKVLFFVMTLVASAFIVPNAFAAAPQYYENFAGNKEIFFANGTPITISERTDSVEGALITWEGGQQLVTGEVGVFGGSHNSDVKVNTSITMNGGTVRNIIGGGLHKSSVGTAEITLNGGTVKVAIYGGGYDGYVWGNNENCSCANTNTLEKAKDSTVRVDEVTIMIYGGSVAYVMGGGGGYNYVGRANVLINDLDAKATYVTAAGTNGYTSEAALVVSGGEIGTVKGAMRGTTEKVEILIDGGKIDNVFAAAPNGIDSENATVKDATVMLVGGEIGNVSTGTSGSNNAPAEEAVLAYDEEVFDERLFANSGFDEENITTTVDVTLVAVIEGFDETFEITTPVPKGIPMTEEEIEELLAAANADFADTGIVFKGFFADKDFKVEYDFTKPFEDDTTVYMVYGEEEKEVEAPAEKNPETSDINMMALIIALLIGGTGLAFTIKNRKFN